MAIIGKVESLWRYPVKSMRGEKLNEAFVSFAGLYGDRLFAFRSAAKPKSFPYLTGREQAKMLLYRAYFRHPTRAAKPPNLAEAETMGPGLNPIPGDTDLVVDVETSIKRRIGLVVFGGRRIESQRGDASMFVRRSVVAIVLVCLLLVGLGAGMSTAAPAPGTLRVSYLQRILSLDPHGSAGAERMSWIIGRHLYNQLVSWDYTAKKFEPQLALRWRNVDPTTWEFELRRGVKFHDGRDFTSASVKTSVERVIAMKGPLAPLFAPVQSVETPDSHRVIIKTQDPVGTMLSNLTILAMVPAGTPPTPDFGDHPVGTGPFKFTEFVRDARLVLDANPNYWQQGIPKAQRLIFVDIPEVAARATAVETGEIDIAVGLPPEQMKRLRTIQNVKVEVGPTTLTRALWINASRPPFTDVRVRHALQHAINVNAITSSLVAGIATSSTSSIASNVVCYARMTPISYDTTLARKQLAEAGFPRGFDTSIKWTEGNPKEREVSDAIVGQLALVGIRVRNMQQPRAIWLDDLLKLNWDFEISTTGGGTGDPDFTLRRLYHTRSKRTGWSNPEFDKLVDDAAASVNLQQRCAMYKRAQEIIWDQGPAVFLFDPLESYAFRTRVQGFTAPPAEIFSVANAAVSP